MLERYLSATMKINFIVFKLSHSEKATFRDSIRNFIKFQLLYSSSHRNECYSKTCPKVNLLKYLGPNTLWTSKYGIGMVLYGKKHMSNVVNFL